MKKPKIHISKIIDSDIFHIEKWNSNCCKRSKFHGVRLHLWHLLRHYEAARLAQSKKHILVRNDFRHFSGKKVNCIWEEFKYCLTGRNSTVSGSICDIYDDGVEMYQWACLLLWALTSLHKQGGSVMINVLECARKKTWSVHDLTCSTIGIVV